MKNSTHTLSAGLKKTNKWVSTSADQTTQIGSEIALQLPPDATVCLTGDLGAGKTTLIKGLVHQLTGLQQHEINSPTFTYLNIYEGTCNVYHFDLYRLGGVQDFLKRGFDEYLDFLCCIEWSEKILPLLPTKRAMITLEYIDQNSREIRYEI